MTELLRETLHSLRVVSDVVVKPADVVALEFTFANRSSAAVSPVARLIDPQGVMRSMQATIDVEGVAQPLGASDLQVQLPQIRRQGAARLSIAATLREELQDGRELPLQVEIDACDEVVGSNVVFLVARSTPDLSTSTAQVRARSNSAVVSIRNTGGDTAHDVYLRVGADVIQCGDVPAKSEVEKILQLTPAMVKRGNIVFPSVSLNAANAGTISVPILGDRRSGTMDLSCSVEVPEYISPGKPQQIVCRVQNKGAAPSTKADVALDVPTTLKVAEGSVTVAGATVTTRKRRNGGLTLSLMPLEPGETVIIQALVCASDSCVNEATVACEVRAAASTIRSEATIAIEAQPSLVSSSHLHLESDVVWGGESLAGTFIVTNTGNAPANDVLLCLAAPAAETIVGQAAFETSGTSCWTTKVGTIAPGERKIIPFTIVAREHVAEEEESAVTASLQIAGEAPIVVADVAIRVLGEPKFDRTSSRLIVEDNSPVAQDEQRELVIRATNVGSSTARSAIISFESQEQLRVDPDLLQLGDIAAGATASATARISLAVPATDDAIIALRCALRAQNYRGLVLEPLLVRTQAEAGIIGELTTSCTENRATVGDILTLRLELENSGSGNARNAIVRAESTEGVRYVPASVSVNGISVDEPDFVSPLFNEGLSFDVLPPRATVAIEWRVKLLDGAAGRYVSPHARIVWGNGKTALFAAHPVLVANTTAFATSANDVTSAVGSLRSPFVYDAMPVARIRTENLDGGSVRLPAPELPKIGEQIQPAQPPLPETPANAETVAVPEGQPAVASTTGDVVERSVREELGTADEHSESANMTILARDVDETFLAKGAKFLKGCGGRGLLTHIVSISRLLPNRVLTEEVSVRDAYAAMCSAVREASDNLFIRWNVSGFVARANDLETRSMREAVRGFVCAIDASQADVEGTSDLELYCALPMTQLSQVKMLLESEPLGSALVYRLLVGCIPCNGPSPLAGVLERYRGALDLVLSGSSDAALEDLVAEADTTNVDEALHKVVQVIDEMLEGAMAQ